MRAWADVTLGCHVRLPMHGGILMEFLGGSHCIEKTSDRAVLASIR